MVQLPKSTRTKNIKNKKRTKSRDAAAKKSPNNSCRCYIGFRSTAPVFVNQLPLGATFDFVYVRSYCPVLLIMYNCSSQCSMCGIRY